MELGVSQVFGVVGDALNPFTHAIRRDERIKWLGVCHLSQFRGRGTGANQEAMAAAYGSRDVALLNIPQDFFEAKTSKSVSSLATSRPLPETAPSDLDVAGTARLIDGASSVVLFVGFEAHTAQAEIAELAKKHSAGVAAAEHISTS